MSVSAQHGTGRENNDEHPAHPDDSNMRRLERLSAMPLASAISNGLENLLSDNRNVSSPTIPILVLQKSHESFSQTSTNLAIQKDQLESGSELNRSNEVSLATLATFRDLLPRYDQDSCPDKEQYEKNDRGDHTDEDDEIYFSCEDGREVDENKGSATTACDGTHLAAETRMNDYHDIQKGTNDYHNKNATERHLLTPCLLTIEAVADTEFSEDEETEGMKLLANTAVSIMDESKEIHAVDATIDTGAASSFISKETVRLYGLRERPLRKVDIIKFTNPISPGVCTPDTFVQVPVKSKKLGIVTFVDAKLRVLDGTDFGIIFGRPFIGRHHILGKLPKFDRFGEPLFILKGGKRSKGIDHSTIKADLKTDCATVVQKATDDAIKEGGRKKALALESMKGTAPYPTKSLTTKDSTQSGLKDAKSSSKNPVTRCSTGSDSSLSTVLWEDWEDASISWRSKDSSKTSLGTTNNSTISNDGKSLRKF